MQIRYAPALVLTCWIGVACSTLGGPVPVVAEADELAQLAGEWRGYYDSPAVDRRGSIVFTLEAGRDTAFGDVTMVPSGWTQSLGPVEDPADIAREAPRPETLRIAFIQVEGGLVHGTMEPYKDPDCGCAVYTTFEGTVGPDAIEGTFTSRPAHGSQYKGTWYVMRKKEKK
ncbi:MAG: hypothetical protein AMS21_13315 [Gemmatimonas sp. SG8_38_2]|nr:MAG: hypothetical protein AMS21_13315 [Gemmatimonas sp. SG8_38_2]